MYINIHSHKQISEKQFFIENLYKEFDKVLEPGYYSVGLHPWYLSAESTDAPFTEVKKMSTQPNVLAIGECGLDKVCKTPFDLQVSLFQDHIKLANEIRKPLIIHCVRAYDEVLKLLRENHAEVPVIFHGFNKNKEILKKILDSGFYVSFGAAVSSIKTAGVFKDVPMDQFFLETDNSPVSIAEVYAAAAAAKNISVETLSLQLNKNLQSVFNIRL